MSYRNDTRQTKKSNRAADGNIDDIDGTKCRYLLVHRSFCTYFFFCLSYYIGKTDGSSRVSPYPTCAYRPQNRAYHQYTDNRKNLPSASHTHTPNIHSGTPALTKIAKMFSIIICCCSAIYYECLMGKDYMYNSYVFVYIFVLPRAQCICMWPSFRSSEFIQMLIRQRY